MLAIKRRLMRTRAVSTMYFVLCRVMPNFVYLGPAEHTCRTVPTMCFVLCCAHLCHTHTFRVVNRAQEKKTLSFFF